MTVVIKKVDSAIDLGQIAPNMTLAETTTIICCMRMSSIVWEGKVDDVIACIWGLIPPSLMSNQAYLWLYTTDLINEHRFLFVRHSQRMIEIMLKEYPIIVGHTHVESTQAIRWLKWLGAEFTAKEGQRLAFTIQKKHG